MSVLNAFFHFTRHAVYSNNKQLEKSITPGLTAAGPRSRDGPAVARCGCILVCVVNVVYTRFAENNNDDKQKNKKKLHAHTHRIVTISIHFYFFRKPVI